MSDPIKTPLEMFYRWEKETPDQVYLRQPENLQWHEFTWREVADQVRRIAGFIRSKGYPEGSRLAIWATNSKDWPIVDLAIQLAGHISVPLYPGQDIASARYIFEHSETKLLFAGKFNQAANVSDSLTPGMETVAMLDCGFAADTSLEEIIRENQPYAESPVPNPEDIFTIVYTSGTTGNPKGVMHMHQSAAYVAADLIKAFQLDQGENRFFSFLPMSHIAERMVVEINSLYVNGSISFSQGLATFADEIRSVQPTLFFAVPRLWIKFKEAIDARTPPAAQVDLSTEQKSAIAHQLGLGEARCILTGSAPTPKDIASWYLNMGIALREAYGMTENCIHSACWSRTDKAPVAGCVGQPYQHVQMRISDIGEIQFKSNGLMKGYYKSPDKTAEVMTDDGFYKTGDAGRIDDDGNLWITGRIGEVFKTSKGKFVVPSGLEGKFARNHHLAQFCIVGHGMDQPVLLATLSEAGLAQSHEALKAELAELLDEVNSELSSHERVAKIYLDEEWGIENNLLTPTLKMKRKAIEAKYRDRISSDQSEDKIVFL